MKLKEIKIHNQNIRQVARKQWLSTKELAKMFNITREYARQLAGPGYIDERKKVLKEKKLKELLPQAESLARKLKRLPLFKELDAITANPRLSKVLHKHLKKLGFKGGHRFSDDYLLDNMRTLAKKLGHAPGEHDISREGVVSATTYASYFGSFSKAQKAAGLVPTKTGQTFGKNRRHDDEQMLEHLRQLAKELGRSPYGRDLNTKGKINAASYVRHFGSLKYARKKAGLSQPLHGMTLRKLIREKTAQNAN